MSESEKTGEELRAQGEDARRLGRIVEKELSLWLTKAGLTTNHSEEDEQGWDVFVQFPGSLEVVPFLDLAAPTRSCMIQVKGTTNREGKMRLTLANAMNLAKYPGPAFLFVAHVLGTDLSRVWMLHVDAALIERVLKRAAACVDREDTALNQVELALTMPDTAAVLMTGDAVRAFLEGQIGDDMFHYVERKRGWLADVGYASDRKELSVVFRSEPDSAYLDDLADFAVGLRKELPVERLDIYDLRFGQERLEERIEHATLQFPELPTGPDVRVTVAVGEERAELQCKSFHARALFPFLPASHDKMRMQSEHLGFVIERHQEDAERMSMHWSTSNLDVGVTSTNLDAAAAAAKALRLIRSGRARVWFTAMDVA